MATTPMNLSEAFDYAIQRHQAGAPAEAEKIYRQVLAVEPNHAPALDLLGVAAHQQGRSAEGIAAIKRAIEINPSQPEFHDHLGAIHCACNQWEPAIGCFRQALSLQPNNPNLHFNLGVALASIGQNDAAIDEYEAALRLAPSMSQALYNLGNIYRDRESWVEAEKYYRQAVAARPGYTKARLNLAGVFASQRRLDEAIDLYTEILAAEPNYVEAYNNRGLAYTYRGDLDLALADFERAIELQPDHVEAHKNRAVAWLFQGDYERGWPEFEWRWQSKDYGRNPYLQPAWDGQPHRGTLIAHAEYGMGDAIQFVRFALEAAERVGEIVVVCHPALVPLLQQCTTLKTVVPAGGGGVPIFGVQASLISMANLLKVAEKDLGNRVPYLHPPAAHVAHWREKMAQLPGLRVGLVWQGNTAYRADRFRSMPLAELNPLGKVLGVTFISLQKGYGSDQLTAWQGPARLAEFASELDVEGGAFLDTVAIMKNLDLMITSDTAAAHLAGALGVPTWLALAHVAEWRWLLGRDDSPWYPTMRLFRQAAPGDWASVFERMAQRLRKWLEQQKDDLAIL